MASFLIASAGVTVDGSDTNDTIEVITGASALTVKGAAGEDTVTISATAVTLGDSNIGLGAGDDTFQLVTAATTGLNFQSATIKGGAGDDTISIGALSSELNSVDVRGNEGDDTLNIDLTSIEGTASSLDIQGNAGKDTIKVTGDAADTLFDSYIGGGKGDDSITYEGSTFRDSTLIGGFGSDTATAYMDVDSGLIQLGDGSNSSTDSADVLVYSGAIANSSVKAGAGDDTITMDLNDNSTAAVIEGNLGADTFNISAAGDYESTEIRGGQGNDTINFSGVVGTTASADIFGGAGDDDINFSNATGMVIAGGEGADDLEWRTGGATYSLAFGDSTEGTIDQIAAGAATTGSTVEFTIADDISIQSSETVTATVGGVEYQLEVTGGAVFFGKTGINDVTAAVDFLEGTIAADEAIAFSFASSRDSGAAGDEHYLYVNGQSDETDLVVEMTDLGMARTGGGFALTEANTFGATDITYTV